MKAGDYLSGRSAAERYMFIDRIITQLQFIRLLFMFLF